MVRAIVAATLLVGLAGSAAAQAAAEKSAGGYKIGVVDRKAVFDEYQKKINEWAALEKKKKGIEDQLNAKFDALKKDREAFQQAADSMTETQRSQKESELNKRLLDLQTEARLKQDEVTKDGERIIKAVTGEINAAIQKIGQDGGYHLILEADTAISSVVYFAEPLNITGQVKQYLETHGGASAAAQATPSDSAKAADKTAKGEKKR